MFTTRLVNPLFHFSLVAIILSSVSLVFIVRSHLALIVVALLLDYSLATQDPDQVGRLGEQDMEKAGGTAMYSRVLVRPSNLRVSSGFGLVVRVGPRSRGEAKARGREKGGSKRETGGTLGPARETLVAFFLRREANAKPVALLALPGRHSWPLCSRCCA